jgi:hypothetical protein
MACRSNRRLKLSVFLVVLLVLPAMLQGEILVLRDGSELKGRIVSFEGDTLVFEPSFGGRIFVHRENIARIVYDEGERRKPAAPATGKGSVSVRFEHRKLSSKVVVTKKLKRNQDEIIRANWIEQYLIVGLDTLFSRVDTTMDKTVYKGHERLYKNSVELEDFQVGVPAGVHRCVLVVRNRGADTHAEVFDDDPLDLRLVFDAVNVVDGLTIPLKVGIDKGFLRLGEPRLVIAE